MYHVYIEWMASFTNSCDVSPIPKYETVNPSFDVDILIKRCLSDIDNFYSENNIIINNQNMIESEVININDLTIKSIIQNVKEIITIKDNITIIKDNIVQYIKGQFNMDDLTKFDYLTYVSNLKDDKQKNIFWILRTILFYLLLIHVTIQLQEDLTIKEELHNFHLGIFGSLTPTSDIDVGIRYVGDKHELCKLSFIVETVEDAFINFIGVKNSLALDIEPYADMYILPNWGKKEGEPEDMFF